MKPALTHKSPLDWLDELVFAAANLAIYAGDFKFVRRWRRRMKRWPRIACPELYSERMLWRKLVDRNPLFVVFSDKLQCKDYMKRLCPELPQPRTLWTGTDAAGIPDEVLRGDVFLKANHGCDMNHRIRAGRYDRAELQALGRRWLDSLYGREERQWAYRDVPRRLFVEEAIGDVEQGLLELNFRASNGRVILGSVIVNCKTPKQRNFYLDAAGRPVPGWNDAEGGAPQPLPEGLDILEPWLRAGKFAERLSVGVDYARFDFMWNGRELYGGEITVYPAAGIFDPANHRTNAITLNGWDLLQSHFLKTRHGWAGRIYAGALKRRLRKSLPLPVDLSRLAKSFVAVAGSASGLASVF